MESLLLPMRNETESRLNQKEKLLTVNTEPLRTEQRIISLSSPEDVLDVLKSAPGRQLLGRALRWLTCSERNSDGFNIKMPCPKAAQIIHVLVNSIIPNYWTSFNQDHNSDPPREKRLLVRCLRSVAGIGALISRLRLLISLLKESQAHAKIGNPNKGQPLEELLDVVRNVLEEDGFTPLIWNDISTCTSQSSLKSLQWKEFLALVASGRILSLTSEATIILNGSDSSTKAGIWVADGNQYATWLGRNIQEMMKTVTADDVECAKAISQLLSKALILGYTGQFRSKNSSIVRLTVAL